MVKVDGDFSVDSDGKVSCSLFADSLDEILDMNDTEEMEIVGLPQEYRRKLAFGCDAMDSNGTLIFLQSDGTWNR